MNEIADSADEFRKRLSEVAENFGGRTALARAAGTNYRVLLSYLTKAEPTRPVLSRLIHASGVDPSWLLFGKQSEPPMDRKLRPDCGEVARRIRLLRPELTAVQLSEMTAIPTSAIEDILEGRDLLLSELMAIAEALGVTPDWLLGWSFCKSEDDDHYVRLPRFDFGEYLNHFHKGGADAWRKDAHPNQFPRFMRGEMAFSREWLARNCGSDLSGIVCAKVETAEMEPLLRRGDEILVDLNRDAVEYGVYLIKWENSCLIRIVYPGASENVQLKVPSAEGATISRYARELRADSCIIGRICQLVGSVAI